MIFTKTLLKMFKQGLILKIMNQTDHFQKRKIKSNWVKKRYITWKNHKKSLGLRSKPYSYLIDDGSEDKKAKSTKKYIRKRKLKLFKSG